MLLYSLGLLAAIILTSPYWLLRMLWSGRYRDGLGQRTGAVSQALREFVAGRNTIWVHAVSVGEVIAVSRLVELLDGIDPKLPVVVSTTTPTGQRLAAERFGDRRVFYFPLDFAWIVRRYLLALQPCMLVLMESELWPRILFEAHRASVPVVVVNGRISDRSLPRYRALRRLWRPLLRTLRLVMAQTPQDEKRFLEIGTPAGAMRTGGNLKFDVRTAGQSKISEALREHLPRGAKILAAGSTLDAEEQYLLTSFRDLLSEFPHLVMILAPRHPERFHAVANLVRQAQFQLIRRSEWLPDPQPIAPGTVFLLDSMGELASLYSLASVAFVGGSLVPAGGHNPLEPAQFAVPIVIGPYVENFRGIVAMLLEQDAIRVTPPERLTAVVEEMLGTPAAADMGGRARQVFLEHAGASETCRVAIMEILSERTALGLRSENEQ